MKILMMICLVAGLVSCAADRRKLSSKGAKVKILGNKKGHGCSVLDKVMGENEIGSVELAKKSYQKSRCQSWRRCSLLR